MKNTEGQPWSREFNSPCPISCGAAAQAENEVSTRQDKHITCQSDHQPDPQHPPPIAVTKPCAHQIKKLKYSGYFYLSFGGSLRRYKFHSMLGMGAKRHRLKCWLALWLQLHPATAGRQTSFCVLIPQ